MEKSDIVCHGFHFKSCRGVSIPVLAAILQSFFDNPLKNSKNCMLCLGCAVRPAVPLFPRNVRLLLKNLLIQTKQWLQGRAPCSPLKAAGPFDLTTAVSLNKRGPISNLNSSRRRGVGYERLNQSTVLDRPASGSRASMSCLMSPQTPVFCS